MDKTLYFYMQYAIEMQNLFVKHGVEMSITKLKNNINEIQTHIKNIQTVAKKLADVSNIANELVLQRKRNILKSNLNSTNSTNLKSNLNSTNLTNSTNLNNSTNLTTINLFPSEKDFTILLNKYDNTKINIIDNYNESIPVKIVDSVNDVPINYIYYIKNIKQFGYNINGLTITGNIGNIFNKDHKNEIDKHNLTICKYGIECKNINKEKKCNYYHDPNDIINLNNKKIINNENKDILLSNNIFNFTNGGWIYDGNILNDKTKNMRHIGGRNTIKYDLEVIKNNIELYQDEIEKRKAQSMHDIIILAYLLNNQYMSDYLYWN